MLEYSAVSGYIPLKLVPSFRVRIPDGENVNSCQNFAYVVDCIARLMQNYLPGIGSKPLSICYIPSYPNPICYRSTQKIVLNADKISYSNQVAYEFAHELCHYAIPHDVCQSLRWIEESICQLSSIFFLHQIAHMWRITDPNFWVYVDNVAKSPYYLSFIQYAQDDAQKYEFFDFTDQEVLAYLHNECEDRPKNRHLANRLFPLFMENPALWQAVPVLCQVNQATLHESLDAWILQSPESLRPDLQKIRDWF